MIHLNLNTPQAWGIVFGLIVAIILYIAPTPPGFAIAVGIIAGVVAFFILNDKKKGQ